MRDVYKEAVMRVLPAAPEIPVADYPPESLDMQVTIPCPACGATDAIRERVEDAEVAKCPCGCEFPTRVESISRHVIRSISERRQRRFARFIESLPRTAPVAGLNPVDYDLFRKVVDEIESENPEAAVTLPPEA